METYKKRSKGKSVFVISCLRKIEHRFGCIYFNYVVYERANRSTLFIHCEPLEISMKTDTRCDRRNSVCFTVTATVMVTAVLTDYDLRATGYELHVTESGLTTATFLAVSVVFQETASLVTSPSRYCIAENVRRFFYGTTTVCHRKCGQETCKNKCLYFHK